MSTGDKRLEDKLREKLEKGEISQEEFDNLYAKFDDLDLLSSRVKDNKRKSYSYVGSRIHEGGDVDDIIRVSGKFMSNDSLKCRGMKISGSADINGDLTVTEATSISGKLQISQNATFEGPFKLSGKADIGGDIDFDDLAKISGKLISSNDIDASSLLKISGKLKAANLISTNTVHISGSIDVDENVEANRFETSGGGSNIGGTLKANSVEIARRMRERGGHLSFDNDFEDTEVEMFPEIARFVTRLVTQVVPNIVQSSLGSISVPRTFSIGGNIEGDIVDISYTHVRGDIIANTVILGPEVIVDGTIYYTTLFEAANPENYNVIKSSESTDA